MKNKLLVLILLINPLISTSQEPRASFGVQYKPIIPSKYFNSSHVNSSHLGYNFKLEPKYSNSFGMIIRYEINKIFWIESALNYTNRNYSLDIKNNTLAIHDYTDFNVRAYDIPLQLLTYIRTSELWHLNVAFGISNTILASDVQSYGNMTNNFLQNFYRKNGGYRALLANVGIEYRKEQKGDYYIGISLHMPWTETGRIYPEYTDENNLFNDTDFNNKFFVEIPGNYLTLDLRYFFPK